MTTPYDPLYFELLKALLSIVGTLTTLLLGWFVTQRVAASWNLYQKRRELDLLNAKEFQSLYGQFFSIWKLWNYYRRDIGQDQLPGASRWELLKMSSAAEGTMEAMFMRLSSERELTEGQVTSLGVFRQLYQSLREAIRDNEPLEWNHAEDADYMRFKTLGVEIAYFIAENKRENKADKARIDSLVAITSNIHELPPAS